MDDTMRTGAAADTAAGTADGSPRNQPQNPFTQVPVEITISVGRARPLVGELLRLRRDSVLPLDRKVEDPVDLYIGDTLIARGELLELTGDQAGQLAVRLTEVADLKNGL